MSRSMYVPGGELERLIMNALWLRDDATTRELYEAVGLERGVVYTTVAKVLDRLHEKGVVRRRRVGSGYAYRIVARQADTQRAVARRFVEQLAGAGPRSAAAALVGAIEDVSPEILAELTAELELRMGKRNGT